MAKLTIQDIAEVLVQKNGLTKQEALQFVSAIFETVQDGLQQERLVKIKGLGTFKVIEVDARESVNVNTGERVVIGSHSKITFTPDTAMKELVNKPFSGFETVVLNEGTVFDDMPLTETVEETAETETLENAEPAPVMEEVPPVSPVQEEEPVQEEKPVKMEEPVLEEQPVQEAFVQQEDEQQEAVPDADSQTEDPTKTNKRLWPLLLAVGCVLSFVLGLHYERLTDYLSAATDSPTPPVTTPKTATTANMQPAEKVTKQPAVKDSLKAAAPAEQKIKEEQKVTAADTLDYRKYEEMDARVRTGAYRIVGTDRVIKVAQGETLARIAKRTLGPDMSCYLEVYNNIKGAQTALAEGTEIKIPKLELKKKKRKQTTE